MTEDALNVSQANARLDQVRGIAVAQAVWRNSFFKPQLSVTARKAFCTPPASRGVVARWAFLRPHLRLGNSRVG